MSSTLNDLPNECLKEVFRLLVGTPDLSSCICVNKRWKGLCEGLPKTNNLVAGIGHVFIISKNGRCYSWGSNDYGQLGTKDQGAATNLNLRTPQNMILIGDSSNENPLVDQTWSTVELTEPLQSVAARYHSLGVTRLGHVYSWGLNENEQLGREQVPPHHSEPTLIPFFEGIKIWEVACGVSFSLALGEGGKLYSWGRNNHAQLGVAQPNTTAHVPQLVPLTHPVNHIACGNFHSLASSSKKPGTIFCWGLNNAGQSGQIHDMKQIRKIKLRTAQEQEFPQITQLAAGVHHSLALSNGTVFGWGGSKYGQIGDDHTKLSGVRKIMFYHGSDPIEVSVNVIAAGTEHSLFLSKDGICYWVGRSNYYLSHVPDCSSSLPQEVTGLPRPITSISAGGRHCYALGHEGLVYCWNGNTALFPSPSSPDSLNRPNQPPFRRKRNCCVS